MHNSKGFNLIELMVAVAIVGIIAAIAYPSYTGYISVSRRADAKGALVNFANAMERFYTENGSYQGAADGGGDTGTPAAAVFPSQAPIDGDNKYYNLSITAANATSYTLSAAPFGSQAGDDCGTLTLSSTGARGADIAGCW